MEGGIRGGCVCRCVVVVVDESVDSVLVRGELDLLYQCKLSRVAGTKSSALGLSFWKARQMSPSNFVLHNTNMSARLTKHGQFLRYPPLPVCTIVTPVPP